MEAKDQKKRWLGIGIAACTLMPLLGCATPNTRASATPASSSPAAPSSSQESAAPQQLPQSHEAPEATLPARTAEIFPGTGQFLAGHGTQAETTVTDEGDITLNFVNADVKDVAKSVLGDYLKLNYEISGTAQGTVTIQTSRPLKRSQVLPVLEQTLRLNGLALVHSNGVYKVVPITDAHRTSGAISIAGGKTGQSSGYGIEVVPIQYISAAEMEKLIAPLAPAQGLVHADTARNLLIIEGTQEERETLLEDIRLFDADWLSGMSFALYTPSYTDAEELTKELNQILGGLKSPVADVLKLIPIDRLNAVLAISPQPRYLEQLKAWVQRLDRPGQGSDKRIFVYHVQNGRADDLAATLIKVFGGTVSEPEGGLPLPSGASSYGQSAPQANGSDTMASTGAPPPPPSQNAAPSGSINVTGLGGTRITADETNNALVIMASPQEYAGIESALRQLDVAPKEVFLEAAIAEVTLTNNLEYGVQYFFQPSARHEVTLSDTSTGAIASAFPGLSYVYTSGQNIKVILDALSSITHVDVISSPELLVLNNQAAALQVGDQVPIVTQQAVSTLQTGAPIVNSVQYQDTGVILKVTPRVNRGGVVMMDITQEVSNVTKTTSSGINSPTIQKRKIQSTVAVQDGETIALGGLISDTKTISRNGIPFLQQIPLLGHLFGDTGNDTTRTELIVLITPHVVDNIDKARAITQELRRKLPAVEALLDGKD